MSLKMSPQFLKLSFYRYASRIVTAVFASTTIYIIGGNLQIAPLKEHFNEKPSLNPEIKFMDLFTSAFGECFNTERQLLKVILSLRQNNL